MDILCTEARARHAKHCQTWSKSLVLQRSHPPRSQPCVNPLLNHRFLGVCLILGGGIVGIVWDGMMSNIQRYWLILVLDNLMQFFCALLVFKCFFPNLSSQLGKALPQVRGETLAPMLERRSLGAEHIAPWQKASH